MIPALVSILLVLIVYVFVKSRVEAKDLKRQIKEYDENSYS